VQGCLLEPWCAYKRRKEWLVCWGLWLPTPPIACCLAQTAPSLLFIWQSPSPRCV
jgi:hypothetical protein